MKQIHFLAFNPTGSGILILLVLEQLFTTVAQGTEKAQMPSRQVGHSFPPALCTMLRAACAIPSGPFSVAPFQGPQRQVLELFPHPIVGGTGVPLPSFPYLDLLHETHASLPFQTCLFTIALTCTSYA